MEKQYKVKLNSVDKVEELLQEIYNESVRQINQIQNEIDKLTNSTNLGSETMSMEDKAKYSKAIHDYLGDKEKAIKQKLEVAKLMNEVIKNNGNINDTLNDPSFIKKTSLDIKGLKSVALTLNDDGDDSETYTLKR